ncbi:hypothetical protein BC936DRAFT_139223 [Jimgerdemannia flammicorona]|uniref:Uncharacterized protein n=1 Tax=Jimgerdemannia flammicorona TaxID=994334 RepID=A0A433BAD4_9FUNG|nr:hypothetical protein BC936DRAFT_139223 [Jimgerdemannia flammicorona]
MDPCTVFPAELMSSVLSFLPHGSLHSSTLVSLNWNTVATPLLWSSPWTRYNASWSKILRAITVTATATSVDNPSDPPKPLHTYGTYVKHLNFSQLYYIVNDPLIESLAPLCPNLTTLVIDSPKQFSDSSLLTLACTPCAGSLRHVVLRSCTRVTDTSLVAFLHNTTRLERLELTHGTRITDASLRALARIDARNVRTLSEFDANFAHIVRVSSEDEAGEGSGLVALVDNCTGISRLQLAQCGAVTDMILARIARRLGGKLRTLNVSGCGALTDRGLRSLAGCHVLEKLDISRCRGVLDGGVLAVVEGCVRLTCIWVSDDYGGISRDCLRGIEDSMWNAGEGEKGGRKVKVVRGSMAA